MIYIHNGHNQFVNQCFTYFSYLIGRFAEQHKSATTHLFEKTKKTAQKILMKKRRGGAGANFCTVRRLWQKFKKWIQVRVLYLCAGKLHVFFILKTAANLARFRRIRAF